MPANNKRADKYKAIWLSHSSLSDYKSCQRLYYFQNIYKNPKTGKKISLSSPYKTLGIAVHAVLEDLNKYKTGQRKNVDLLKSFIIEWNKNLPLAGFENQEEENKFKDRGIAMLKNVMEDYKVFNKKTISTKSYYDGNMLPNIFLNEYENIILCGNVDWIEYNSEDNTLSVVDFKTGKREEREDSYQLPIYKILLESLQNKWRVKNGKYWYLDSNKIEEKDISDKMLEDIKKDLLKIGIEIRDKRFVWNVKAEIWEAVANIEDNFVCHKKDKCECHKYDKVINNEAKYLGLDIYNKEVYKV